MGELIMKPEVVKVWEDARSRFKKAQVCFEMGDSDCVVTECKNALCSASIAIRLADLGDAGGTVAKICFRFPSNPRDAIAETRNTLELLRQMAPPEDPFPEI
jgi:hypothetical protein